jgi:hypothetical protein
MPELIPQFTPPPNPPFLLSAPPSEPPEPPAPPPPIPRNREKPPFYNWEEHPAFRYTFLALFTQEGDREALEHIGVMLYDMALEVLGKWPQPSESATRSEMRAVAEDFRHLEAYLASIGAEREAASLEAEDAFLSSLAAKLSPQVGRLAGFIERELIGG